MFKLHLWNTGHKYRSTFVNGRTRYCKCFNISRMEGLSIAQAVSRWLPTAATRVCSRVWSSTICGGQSAAGPGFLRVLRVPLPFIPPNSPSSQSPGAGTIGQLVADVPSGPSLDSTPHYENKKSRRLPITAARVRSQVRSCKIYGRFSSSTPTLIPPNPSYSSLIQDWYSRPISGRLTKWTESNSTPTK
jgi:hypothetical protein